MIQDVGVQVAGKHRPIDNGLTLESVAVSNCFLFNTQE